MNPAARQDAIEEEHWACPAVPERFKEFALEWRAGWDRGRIDTKGHSSTPYFKAGFARARGAAFRNGRDEAMKRRGLIKKTKLEYNDPPAKRKRLQGR